MSEQSLAGIALIVVPILFNSGFALLGQRFDYPDAPEADARGPRALSGRRPRADHALVGVRARRCCLPARAAACDRRRRRGSNGGRPRRGDRCPRLGGPVPRSDPLAVSRSLSGPGGPRDRTGSAAGQAVDVVFQSFNRYLGVAVGEHLGYAFTGLWSILAGVALIDSSVTADWLGVVGVLIGPLFLICSLEFVGRVAIGAGRSPRR